MPSSAPLLDDADDLDILSFGSKGKEKMTGLETVQLKVEGTSGLDLVPPRNLLTSASCRRRRNDVRRVCGEYREWLEGPGGDRERQGGVVVSPCPPRLPSKHPSVRFTHALRACRAERAVVEYDPDRWTPAKLAEVRAISQYLATRG